MNVLPESYNYPIAVLSAFIAVLASWTSLDLAERVTAARGALRLVWLTSGAIAMGIGIWSMHYTAMLAFRLPVPVLYHWPTALLSLLAGIVASAIALFAASQTSLGWPTILAGSVFQGGGIAALHYIAMDSMRLDATCHYSPTIVAFSVLFAIAGSLLSLRLTFLFRNGTVGRQRRKAASAMLMGAAISGMHYTAMAASTFTASPGLLDPAHAVRVTLLGTVGFVTVAVMVLAVALLTCLVDRLEERNALVNGLFEQAPQAIALMSSTNQVVRVNREFTRVFGYTEQEALGRLLGDLIVPGDLRDEFQRFVELVSQGQRVDTEAIRRRKDGSRLPVLVVSVPISVPGGQVARCAIYRDITERKEAEEALRTLSGRLLRLEDEERRRLARELHDTTAQLLASLSMNLSVVSESGEALNPRARAAMAESITLADQCLREIRTVSYLLHPPELDELGLESALSRYIDGFIQRSGIRVEFEVSPDLGRLPQAVETTLFRIVQECLTNIHRHSGSTTARIRLIRGVSSLVLEVEDAGHGIGDAPSGVGIASMRERVQQLNGQFEIASYPDGTTVKAMILL